MHFHGVTNVYLEAFLLHQKLSASIWCKTALLMPMGTPSNELIPILFRAFKTYSLPNFGNFHALNQEFMFFVSRMSFLVANADQSLNQFSMTTDYFVTVIWETFSIIKSSWCLQWTLNMSSSSTSSKYWRSYSENFTLFSLAVIFTHCWLQNQFSDSFFSRTSHYHLLDFSINSLNAWIGFIAGELKIITPHSV